MVIYFEENDRAAIENKGMTIIEFKRILYKAVDWVNRAVKAAIEFFYKLIENLTDAYRKFKEKISDMLEDMKKWYFSIPEPQRNKIVKWYAKCNKHDVFVSRNKVYHCRNNC